MKTYKEFVSERRDLSTFLLSKLRKLTNPEQYLAAAKTLQDVLKRKSEKKELKHSIQYYADEIAKTYTGVDRHELLTVYQENNFPTFGLSF